jgi:hypothetical protein
MRTLPLTLVLSNVRMKNVGVFIACCRVIAGLQRLKKPCFASQSKTEILAVSLDQMPHFANWYGTQTERFHYIPPFLSPERFHCKIKHAMRAHLRNAFGFGADDFVYLLTGSGFAMKGLRPCDFSNERLAQTFIKQYALSRRWPRQSQAF